MRRFIKKYVKIAKLNKSMLKDYAKKLITNQVILTYERLNKHILKYHKTEYEQIEKYLKLIIQKPDYIIEDNSHADTLIFLKHIDEINKKARIVIKLATNEDEEKYTQNSIITIMRQRNKSWEQTLKNRGKIIYKSIDKLE